MGTIAALDPGPIASKQISKTDGRILFATHTQRLRASDTPLSDTIATLLRPINHKLKKRPRTMFNTHQFKSKLFQDVNGSVIAFLNSGNYAR